MEKYKKELGDVSKEATAVRSFVQSKSFKSLQRTMSAKSNNTPKGSNASFSMLGNNSPSSPTASLNPGAANTPPSSNKPKLANIAAAVAMQSSKSNESQTMGLAHSPIASIDSQMKGEAHSSPQSPTSPQTISILGPLASIDHVNARLAPNPPPRKSSPRGNWSITETGLAFGSTFDPLPVQSEALLPVTVGGSNFGEDNPVPVLAHAPTAGWGAVQNRGKLALAFVNALNEKAAKASCDEEEEDTDSFRFMGLTFKKTQVSITFENLNLHVPVPGTLMDSLMCKKAWKQVLVGVNGKVAAGKLTAIMGPSGSGKSSLLNVLTGKAGYGKVDGSIKINGREDQLHYYSRNMGFVPQDDVMLEELSVLENLFYSAQLRLPSIDRQHLHRIVYDVLRVLGLEHIAHTRVGNVEARGISGGERKRVNIGLELTADPTLLFLDEPTSGLDSATSLKVLNALRRMCRIGSTVVTVIHQPRSLIFNMFDDIILLKKGGQVVYAGPACHATTYFEGLGFSMPNTENPADWLIDVICGDLSGKGLPTPDEQVTLWAKNGAKFLEEHPGKDLVAACQISKEEKEELLSIFRNHDKDGNGRLDGAELSSLICTVLDAKNIEHFFEGVFSRFDDGDGLDEVEFVEAMSHILHGSELNHSVLADPHTYPTARGTLAKQPALTRPAPGFLRVYLRCLARDFRQKWRKTGLVMRDILLITIVAVGLGLLHGTGTTWDMIPVQTLQSHLALGLISCIIGLRAFGTERENRWREAASGLNVSMYFLAKVTGQIFEIVILGTFFSLMFHFLTAPRIEVGPMLCLLLGLSWAMTPFGMIFSIFMPPVTAMIASVLWPVITVGVVSGVSPTLRDFASALDVISVVSPGRWSIEGHVMEDWAGYRNMSQVMEKSVERYTEHYGFKYHVWDNVQWLFVMGIGWRFVTFLFVHYEIWSRR
uniref:ABC transporter domain-containing protein n=1 Tax=Hemiselmis andersenii TaxID=464988 RepID=A0A6T8JEM1_HEMAN